MAFIMVTEKLYDADFVSTHCVGFDADQIQVPGAESYREYILGIRDGVPKTPQWAESITGVPADIISRVARDYATLKPGILYQGYGMQRRAYGEQVVRAGCVLAAFTSNIGISGGWAGGLAKQVPDGGPLWTVFPVGENPVKAEIPVFLWTEACLHGHKMTAAHGVRGVERLESDIKLIYAVATNCLINQHADINRTVELLRDESKVEFITVQDNFLTPTARFADIVLPACTQFETWGVEDGWKYGDEVILQPKIIEPLGDTRSDYRICSGLAERLGILDAFTSGRDEKAWVEFCLDEFRRLRFPDLPTLKEFIDQDLGVWTKTNSQPAIAFADFRKDPQKYPLETPSGKIEIFSQQLYDLHRPDEIPAIPKYIQEWDSPFAGSPYKKQDSDCSGSAILAERPTNPTLSSSDKEFPMPVPEYPLQAIGHHAFQRVHSTQANNDWLQQIFPQRIYINPIDAAARGIANGELVKVFNSHGALVCISCTTVRIMLGVVDIPQGAWYQPDQDGVDLGGNVNMLTSWKWTPFAFGTAQHTIMVQVIKLDLKMKNLDSRWHRLINRLQRIFL
jgi:anaerobic dimethyl sulfoxide reductase subunit A